MDKLIFFLRAYNDIDHIVPVIYKWLSLEDAAVDIVITTHQRFLSDLRLNLLKRFDAVNLHFIGNFSAPGESIPKHVPNTVSSLPRIKDNAFVTRMMDQLLTDVRRSVVVFDWTYTEFAEIVTGYCRELGVPTVSLPHGDAPFINKLETKDILNYTPLDDYVKARMFDHTVVPNELCAGRYNRFLDNRRLRVLGSPRYNDEWLEIISKITPPYKRVTDNLKIVFFLRDYNYAIFWEEVIRVLKLVLQFPGVELVVKHHTRTDEIEKLVNAYSALKVSSRSNLEFVFEDVHSPALIEWADLVLDLGTSAVFQALKIDKPVLALDYLHPNYSTIAYYMKDCEVRCRDKIYDTVDTFLKRRDSRLYSLEERERFIAKMIDVPDANVLKRYVDFLKECLAN